MITVVSSDAFDGGDHRAAIDVLSIFELCVMPVFSISSQSTVRIVEFNGVHVPIISWLVCVFAINKRPLNVSVDCVTDTITIIQENELDVECCMSNNYLSYLYSTR